MKMSHILFPISAIILFAVFFFSAGGSSATSRMPAFSLPNVIDGKTIDSQDFQGKALLVTFFSTWCPPCMEEVPTLIKLQKEFAKDGFSVIGLSLDERDPGAVVKLIGKKGINYPVMMADSRTINNFGGVQIIPVSFLINRSGNVVKKYPGEVPLSVLARDIKNVMD